MPWPVTLKKLKMNVLWRPTRPSRTNTQKRWTFHYRGLECKSRKSRNTWSKRQIWPFSTEWSRAKANRVLPREHTGHCKHPLPTTQEKTLHMDITRWSTPKSIWVWCWSSDDVHVYCWKRVFAMTSAFSWQNWKKKTKTLGEGNSNPFQYSCLENPMVRGQSMRLQRIGHNWVTFTSFHTHTHTHKKH